MTIAETFAVANADDFGTGGPGCVRPLPHCLFGGRRHRPAVAERRGRGGSR
jgi:hypothetical protein